MNMFFCAEEYKRQLMASNDINSCPKVPLPKIDVNQNYIFISYSHKDYKYVYSDLADMYEAGVRFWYDSGLSAGKKWDEEVYERITDACCVGVVFYMSENLFLSKSANHEIEITRSRSNKENNEDKNIINYFSVNLTDKLPIDILSTVIRNDSSHSLDMRQIGILSQAFPDNSTYVCYNTPNHKEELISQIQTQFSVINDSNEPEPFAIDSKACEVVIGSLESISSGERQERIRHLSSYLGEEGFSVYVMQDAQLNAVNDNLKGLLKEHIEKQNAVKLDSAQCLILISSLFGWNVHARFFGEFDSNIIQTKKIIYLIDDSGVNAARFKELYRIDMNSPEDQSIMNRVFFLDNYEGNIKNALKK